MELKPGIPVAFVDLLRHSESDPVDQRQTTDGARIRISLYVDFAELTRCPYQMVWIRAD